MVVYFLINESVAKALGKERVYFHSTVGSYDEEVSVRLRFESDYIFSVKDGKTFYHKNRTGSDYQYTSEELVILKLKALPAGRYPKS